MTTNLLLLTITLATNQLLVRIDASGVTNNHIYSIQSACILNDTNLISSNTNWYSGWIFLGNYNGTNSFYDYADTNKFYRIQDMGFKF